VINAEQKLSPVAGQFPNGTNVLQDMLMLDMHTVSQDLATPPLPSRWRRQVP
jgi:hypothetical protein